MEQAINQIQQLDEECINFDMILNDELMKSKERTGKMEEGKQAKSFEDILMINHLSQKYHFAKKTYKCT